jgi:hypothetical protein
LTIIDSTASHQLTVNIDPHSSQLTLTTHSSHYGFANGSDLLVSMGVSWRETGHQIDASQQGPIFKMITQVSLAAIRDLVALPKSMQLMKTVLISVYISSLKTRLLIIFIGLQRFVMKTILIFGNNTVGSYQADMS